MKRPTAASWDEARRSFWLLPSLGLTLGVALGFALPALDLATHLTVPLLRFSQPSAARTLLQTVATVSVSVGGVAFSVTVVAFQLASQQLSPRVLRTFQTDRLSQSLLAALLGLGIYSLIVLGRLPAGGHTTPPDLSTTVAIGGSVIAFALFAAFIHDIVISLQASTLIRRIAEDGQRAIAAGYPSNIGKPPEDMATARQQVEGLKQSEPSVSLRSTRGGFLQTIHHDHLMRISRKHDALIEQRLPIGDFAVTDMVLAQVWARSGHEDIEQDLLKAFGFSDERTVVADVAFPVRQLADIALRALSPAMNDPTTAENAMGSLTETLVIFARRESPCPIRCDDEDTPRFVAIAPELDDLVRLGFDQVGRSSGEHPTFVRRLLTLLEHVESVAKTRGIGCPEIRRQQRLLRAYLRDEPST